MADFWKIECLSCGINAELLTDDWHRIICRECLNESEFSKVQNKALPKGRYPNGSAKSFRKDLEHGESLAVCDHAETDSEDEENDQGFDLTTEGF